MPNQEIDWLKKQITLLRLQVQEWQSMVQTEKQARLLLRERQDQEVSDLDLLSSLDRPLARIELLAYQAKQLTQLSQPFTDERKFMRHRQEQEQTDLEALIQIQQIT